MAFGNWYPGKAVDWMTGGSGMKEKFGSKEQQDYTGGSSPTDPTSAWSDGPEGAPGVDSSSLAGIAYDSRTAQSPGRQFASQDFDVSDKGQVQNIQQILSNEGYDISVDGMFGPQTEAAYRDFINKTRTAHGGEAYRWNAQEAQPGYWSETGIGSKPAVPYEAPPLTMHGDPHNPKTGDR